MAETAGLAVLRALGANPGARPYVPGHSDQQIAAALDELRRRGLVQGLELTEKGRALLEGLSR